MLTEKEIVIAKNMKETIFRELNLAKTIFEDTVLKEKIGILDPGSLDSAHWTSYIEARTEKIKKIDYALSTAEAMNG